MLNASQAVQSWIQTNVFFHRTGNKQQDSPIFLIRVLRATMRSLAILLLASIAIQVEASCFDSLDPIRVAEDALEDDSELRTYVLCPETVFRIAKVFNQDGSPKNGQYPLVLGRSNIHIMCGDDGKSENNCVLKGGLFHVGFYDEYETGTAVTNALVQGLTFQDAKNTNVLAENEGDISLRDCIFKVRRLLLSLSWIDSCSAFILFVRCHATYTF
jgi:hypothetical protein